VLVPERSRPLEQRTLDVVEQAAECGRQAAHRDALLLARVSARHQHRGFLDVLRSDFDPERHAPELPLGELPPRPLVAFIERHADSGRRQIALNLASARQHGLAPVLPADRHDDDLIGGDARRQDQAAVVAVRHDHAADETGRYAPGCAPDVLERFIARLKRDVERLREVLAEVVRRAGLQGAAVAHQRFDRIGAKRARELLALALDPFDDRHGQHRFRDAGVQVEDHQRLRLRLLMRFVCRMPFLPEKLSSAQEWARDLLPADDVRPLIDQNGQVAP
jgi:hypothetical protein